MEFRLRIKMDYKMPWHLLSRVFLENSGFVKRCDEYVRSQGPQAFARWFQQPIVQSTWTFQPSMKQHQFRAVRRISTGTFSQFQKPQPGKPKMKKQKSFYYYCTSYLLSYCLLCLCRSCKTLYAQTNYVQSKVSILCVENRLNKL